MAKLIHALNTASGQVGLVPESYLNIPHLKDWLVQVDPDTKSYEPEKYKPVTATEYRETHVEKVPAKARSLTTKPADKADEKPVDPAPSSDE